MHCYWYCVHFTLAGEGNNPPSPALRGANLVLLTHTDEPLVALRLAHRTEAAQTTLLATLSGLLGGSRGDTNLNLAGLEVGRAHGREALDGQLNDACAVQRDRAVLDRLPLLLQLNAQVSNCTHTNVAGLLT